MVDWLPTIATIAGADAPELQDGVDLSAVWLDQKPIADVTHPILVRAIYHLDQGAISA